jgi:hypothetical protein
MTYLKLHLGRHILRNPQGALKRCKIHLLILVNFINKILRRNKRKRAETISGSESEVEASHMGESSKQQGTRKKAQGSSKKV